MYSISRIATLHSRQKMISTSCQRAYKFFLLSSRTLTKMKNKSRVYRFNETCLLVFAHLTVCLFVHLSVCLCVCASCSINKVLRSLATSSTSISYCLCSRGGLSSSHFYLVNNAWEGGKTGSSKCCGAATSQRTLLQRTSTAQGRSLKR